MSDSAPIVRFTRDKRGYEHFYLIRPSRGGRDRQRILYWFRTPPNVKVGRPPFDEERRQAIERQNPGIEFDWDSLLDISIPPVEIEQWRERRRNRALAKAEAARSREEPTPDEPAAALTAISPDQAPATIDGAEPPATAAGEPGADPGRRKRRRRRRGRRSNEGAANGVPAALDAAGAGSPNETETDDETESEPPGKTGD